MNNKKEIINIKSNFKIYNQELKNIKENIMNINSDLKKINSFIKSDINQLNNKVTLIEKKLNVEPNTIKQSILCQTNSDNNSSNTNIIENKIINDESDENKRNVINEKKFQNISEYKMKKNNKDIYLGQNINPTFYDVGKYWLYEKNKTYFHNKRFYSPQNKSNRNIYKKEKDNGHEEKENQNTDVDKTKKDIFLIYNKNNLLKDKNLKYDNLEQSIFESIKNLINQHKKMKKNINTENNTSLSLKETGNNYISLKNKKKLKYNIIKDNNNEKTNKQNISPIVDKLYKDFSFRKRKKEDKILNKTNIIPKRIIPVFGRTFYAPIKEKRNNLFSENYNKII